MVVAKKFWVCSQESGVKLLIAVLFILFIVLWLLTKDSRLFLNVCGKV
jgi:hypothetical protein